MYRLRLKSDVSARADAVVVLGSGVQSAGEAVLGVDALDTVGGVDVLDEGELEAGGTALAGSDGGVGQEVFPDLRELASWTIPIISV